MNRGDFQALADIRIAEAQALFAAGLFDGAYYLAGYSVECALKACIAKLMKQDDFPDKAFVLKCYTHDIDTLVDAAGLGALRETDSKSNVDLEKNWSIVTDWTESSRYERRSEAQAREMIEAVSHATNGVLQWIKVRW